MEPLRTFFMEDWLEEWRVKARWNMGESGARMRTIGELLAGSGVSEAQAAQVFWNTPLADSPNRGRRDLREAIAALTPGVKPDEVLVTTGSSEALLLLFRDLRPQKTALLWPAFQLLYEIPLSLGSSLVPLHVQWTESGAPFAPMEQWLEALSREKPDLLVLNTPHNPSGLVLGPEQIQRLVQAQLSWGGRVVADEHYRLLGTPESPMAPTVWEPHPHVFVTGSFIKCTGSPGLRVGWVQSSDPAILARLQNEKNYTTHTVNPITEWVALECLRNPLSPLFQEVRLEWAANRKTLKSWLQGQNHWRGHAPEGGLVTCVGLTDSSLGRSVGALENLSQRLLSQGVFVLPLHTMEPDGVGAAARFGANPFHFRMGLGIHPQHFLEALDVMDRVASQWAKSRGL